MASIRRLSFALVAFSLPVFAGSVPGIKNFYKVDENVYRGAQPTEEGFQYLAKLGVKSVIDLREADGRAREEERAVTAAGMRYINVPMTGLTPPTAAEIEKILNVLENTNGGAVFVHCKRGADRTGAVIAAYHIEHDKWENTVALKDAMSHGMSFFQLPRQGYIRNFKARTLEAQSKPAADAVAVTAGSAAAPATK